MARDVFTETTTTGLGSRLGGSFKGIIVGLIFTIVSFPLLFWNEGRAVERYKSLNEGQGIVLAIQASEVLPDHQNKLVHFTGTALSNETLSDPLFGVSSDGLKLTRRVEMYQWVEEEKTETKTNTGGSQTKTTTYEYKTEWSSGVVSSSGFRYPDGHTNPGTMPFRSESHTVNDARVGKVRLPEDLVNRIGSSQRLSAQGASIPDGGREGRVAGDYVYYGTDPGNPKVGDLRVSFHAVPESTISVVAELVGESLRPYQTEAGGSLYMLDDGARSAEQMFASEHQANTVMTWILRAVGFFVMWIGLSSLFGPLRVLSDILPFFGRIVGAGIGLVSGVLAVALSGVTIAVAWLFYRPVVALSVLALSGAAIFWLTPRGQESPPLPEPGPAAPPPPPPA